MTEEFLGIGTPLVNIFMQRETTLRLIAPFIYSSFSPPFNLLFLLLIIDLYNDLLRLNFIPCSYQTHTNSF
jgi:hypothetical protein